MQIKSKSREINNSITVYLNTISTGDHVDIPHNPLGWPCLLLNQVLIELIVPYRNENGKRHKSCFFIWSNYASPLTISRVCVSVWETTFKFENTHQRFN